MTPYICTSSDSCSRASLTHSRTVTHNNTKESMSPMCTVIGWPAGTCHSNALRAKQQSICLYAAYAYWTQCVWLLRSRLNVCLRVAMVTHALARTCWQADLPCHQHSSTSVTKRPSFNRLWSLLPFMCMLWVHYKWKRLDFVRIKYGVIEKTIIERCHRARI